jgi:hypothetical protein
VIKKAIEKLGLRHKEHIAAYGEGNERRLTGRHETADINTFCWVSLIFFFVSQSSYSVLIMFTLICVSSNKNRALRTGVRPSVLAVTLRKMEKVSICACVVAFPSIPPMFLSYIYSNKSLLI